MRKLTVLAVFATLGLGGAFASDAGTLAKQSREVLQKYCYKCHNPEEDNYFNALDRKSLLSTGKGNDKPYLTPSKPEQSLIWLASADPSKRNMPPGTRQKLNEQEASTLKEWIEAGAPEAPVETEAARRQIAEVDVLKAIRDHLQSVPSEWRPFQRYFSLVNLHNAPANLVTAQELRFSRAALSKAVNSLSWAPDIVVPTPVPQTDDTVYAVDLRDLNWDENNKWNIVAGIYPYALSYSSSDNKALRDVAQALAKDMGTELFYVRADWFCTVVTQAMPVKTPSDPEGKHAGPYHRMLSIPEQASALEHKLGVNVQYNFDRDHLARAGFNESKVSKQNRLVERHSALYGAYWKSYDFKPQDSREHNLAQSPLGPPKMSNGKYTMMEFNHDGGEMVFNLPNGLQGYMLVNSKDERIDVGPIEVVRDSQETTGTPQIVNGLSCLACHDRGIKPVADTIRTATSAKGDALNKVQRLYVPVSRMDKLLEKDGQRFMRALEEATYSFLNTGTDSGKKISEFPEVVGVVAKRYLKPLTLADMAREVGVTPEKLNTAIQNDTRLNALKGVTDKAGSINRDVWHGRGTSTRSLAQKAAFSMEIGTPLDTNN